MAAADMSDLLQQLESVKAELKKAGVPPETIDRVMAHIDAYSDLKEEVIKARDTQFEDEAYSVATEMQSASNKNVARLARYLRKFAEYVVMQTRGQDGPVNDIVDHLPPMAESEAEAQ